MDSQGGRGGSNIVDHGNRFYDIRYFLQLLAIKMRNAVELHIISAENIRYYWVDLLLEIIIKLIAIGPLILTAFVRVSHI